MKRTHVLIALAALVLAAAFGTWSFAQAPAAPDPPEAPPPPGFFEREIDTDFDLDADMDMPGPGGPMGMGRRGHMRGMMGAGMLAGLAEELGLTEEQQTQLRALHFESAKSGLQTRTNLALRRLELEELLQQDEPNAAELDKRIRALTDAQGAATRQRIEHRMAFRRVLTPEQRAKLRTVVRHHMRQRVMRFREGGGMRMRGPGGEGFQWHQRRPGPPPAPPEPPEL